MFDPYFVLGVSHNADFETLRAAYRRLVRENHPDIAADKTVATVRTAEINCAWLLIGDPEKRGEFDTQWLLDQRERQRLQAQRRAQLERERLGKQIGTRPLKTNQAKSSRSSDKNSRKNAAKMGRKQNASEKNGRSRQGARAKPAPPNPPRKPIVMRRISLAVQLFHRDGKAEEAATICRAILQNDEQNLPARELLGEILAFQGHIEQALQMFDEAIELAPRDRMLRRKRDRLQTRQSVPHKASSKPKKSRLSLLSRLRAKIRGKRL